MGDGELSCSDISLKIRLIETRTFSPSAKVNIYLFVYGQRD